jgi:FkbM family methyltransferase
VTTVSYAQNHEDILLDRAFARGRPGFYIDVGAHEPVNYSVTKHFYDLGWHGINVEPSTRLFEMLRAARPRDTNLNIALSDKPGELTFYEYPPEYAGLSTLSEHTAARHRQAGMVGVERRVPTGTLAEVCERHAEGTIDFLSVDVEGHELEVLSGGDWERWRPRIVVVEATEPMGVEGAGDTPRRMIPTHGDWEHILLNAGYLFAAFDGLNRFYVRSEDADLAEALSVPVNVADGYVSHGYLQMSRQQAADWAANQTLRAEYRDLAAEVRSLRERAEKAERALTATRELHESIRTELDAGLARMEEVLAEVGGIGAAGIGLARRLTAASTRYPRAARLARKAVRAGLDLKRNLSHGP